MFGSSVGTGLSSKKSVQAIKSKFHQQYPASFPNFVTLLIAPAQDHNTASSEGHTHSEMILQGQSLILSLQQQLLRSLHAVAIGYLSGTLIAQPIVYRGRVAQIRQTARSLQQRVLVVREEAALIERQVCAAPAARQAESVAASAATRVERSAGGASRVARLLVQAQVAARSHEILLVAVLREAAAAASHVITVTRTALPRLLLLRGSPDIALDSRASSSSKSGPAARTVAAVALSATGFPIDRPGLFLFLLFLHLYDLILKGRKRASFSERERERESVRHRRMRWSNLCETLTRYTSRGITCPDRGSPIGPPDTNIYVCVTYEIIPYVMCSLRQNV